MPAAAATLAALQAAGQARTGGHPDPDPAGQNVCKVCSKTMQLIILDLEVGARYMSRRGGLQGVQGLASTGSHLALSYQYLKAVQNL
jgi:hypothetical protein